MSPEEYDIKEWFEKDRMSAETPGAPTEHCPCAMQASPTRVAMLSHHVNQPLVRKGFDAPIFLHGSETDFGNTQTPDINGIVYAVAGKYSYQKDHSAPIAKTIFYIEEGILKVYQQKPLIGRNEFVSPPIPVHKGPINPGTLLSGKLEVPVNHDLSTGACYLTNNIRTAFTESIGTGEDGIKIASCLTEPGSPLTYYLRETRVIELTNSNQVMASLDPNQYKPILMVGDTVPANGIIGAVYTLSPTTVGRLHLDRMAEISQNDRITYARPDGKIIDMTIIKGDGNTDLECVSLQEVLMEGWRRFKNYHQQITAVQDKVSQDSGITYSAEACHIIAESLAMVTEGSGVRRHNKKVAIPSWTIKYEILYEIPINKGSKFAGRSGDKGTVIQIVPTEEMPVDHRGRRILMEMNSSSTLGRANPSRNIEMTNAAVLEEMAYRTREAYGLKNVATESIERLAPLVRSGPFELIKSQIIEMFKWVSPRMYDAYKEASEETWVEYIAMYLRDECHILYISTDRNFQLAVDRWIWEVFKLPIHPVYYPHINEYSKVPILSARYSVLELNKLALYPNEASTSPIGIMGNMQTAGGDNRYLLPYRRSPTRAGEAETPPLYSAAPIALAHMIDLINPLSYKEYIEEVYKHPESPALIDWPKDRPLRPNPTLNILNSGLSLDGVIFDYEEQHDLTPDELTILSKEKLWQ